MGTEGFQDGFAAAQGGARHARQQEEVGVLEIMDRVPDVMGERAAVALLRYAAESTVTGRIRRGPRPVNALAVASCVSQAGLRVVSARDDHLEVEAAPGPGVEGLRRVLVRAICQGAVEAAFKSASGARATRAAVTEQADGRFRVVVGRV